MNKDQLLTSLKAWFAKVDWLLLTFLLLVLDVKLVVKVAAVALIYLFRPDFRFGFRLRSPRDSKLPLFYYCMPAIAVLNWLFRHQFGPKQDVLLLFGLLYWGLCLLIVHQLRLFTDKGDPEKLHRTITVFFILNILVSILTLLSIMIKTGTINPYSWQGDGQAYFISTGDYIQGITFDFSLTNALICAIGVLYFLMRKQWGMAIASMCALLITGSNFTNLIIVIVLVILFFFRSSTAQKITTAICLLLLVFFMKVVSPENKEYAEVTIAAVAEHKTIDLTPPDTAFHVSAKEEAFIKKAVAVEDQYTFKPTPGQAKFPGKIISYEQTVQYLLEHPGKLPLGAGAGHFSSKLAFRASSLGNEGGYPAKFVYIDPDFLHNHLSVFLYYFTKGNQHHSIIHTPFSVYNQVLGEYGVLGLVALLFFYFGFFMRKTGKSLYGWLLLGILAGAFCIDYWFEQLSIVILFELLWLLEFVPGASQVIKQDK